MSLFQNYLKHSVFWKILNKFFYSGGIQYFCQNKVRELSSYHHISKKIVWKYYYTTISIGLPTNSGVKIPYRLKVSESAIIFVHLYRGLAPTDLFVLKKPKIWMFSIWVHFETWTLKYQKSIFFKTFGLFGTCYEKMCPSFLWKSSP